MRDYHNAVNGGKKILIKHYRLTKKYGRTKLLKEFPEKNWSETGSRKVLNKFMKWETQKENKTAEDHKRFDQIQILTLLKT